MKIQSPALKSFWLITFAEIQKTVQERVTYRTQMILSILTGVVGLIQFAILAYYIGLGGTPPGLEQYGDNIISFMIIGSLFSAVALMMMNSSKMQIQSEQQRGTLEAISLSHAGLFQFMLAGSFFGVISSLFFSTIIFIAFGMLFEFKLAINPIGLVISILATVFCTWLIGFCAASYILLSKQGEPITWTVTTLLTLFSGVMYPITVFPDFIVSALRYLPTAGMLHAIRISLFSAASLQEVLLALLPTLLTSAVLIPISSTLWKRSLAKVRRNGAIGTY